MTADAMTRLTQAIQSHVPFDGWSETAFAAAAADCGMSLDEARAHAPRGAIDLAVAAHQAGDAAMESALAAADLKAMRYSARVAFAVRARIEAADRETTRRASALFSLPTHAAEGAALVWATVDKIWCALGDTSTDGNWYSKRAILSGVYGSVLLYWLGDESEDAVATWAFLDRRIENVMSFEKFKADARASTLLGPLARGFDGLMGRIHAPGSGAPRDLPGRWAPTTGDKQ